MSVTLQELNAFQTSVFDKASVYSKIVLGLGYAGFFTAWSGTKQHLSVRALISSALCMTVSLIFYLIYEIVQAGAISYLASRFAAIPMQSEIEVADALRVYRTKEQRLMKGVLSVWPVMFLVSALTGLTGAGILIYAFVVSLLHMGH
jgi:hypothetical protein